MNIIDITYLGQCCSNSCHSSCWYWHLGRRDLYVPVCQPQHHSRKGLHQLTRFHLQSRNKIMLDDSIFAEQPDSNSRTADNCRSEELMVSQLITLSVGKQVMGRWRGHVRSLPCLRPCISASLGPGVTRTSRTSVRFLWSHPTLRSWLAGHRQLLGKIATWFLVKLRFLFYVFTSPNFEYKLFISFEFHFLVLSSTNLWFAPKLCWLSIF